MNYIRCIFTLAYRHCKCILKLHWAFFESIYNRFNVATVHDPLKFLYHFMQKHSMQKLNGCFDLAVVILLSDAQDACQFKVGIGMSEVN